MNSSEKTNLLPFNWKAIVIGIVLTYILGLILSYLSKNLNLNTAGFLGTGFLPLIIGSLITGYLAKGHPMNGAIHGGIVGVGIWLIYIIYIFYLNQNMISIFQDLILQNLAISLIANICIGILGGTIGSLILIGKMKMEK